MMHSVAYAGFQKLARLVIQCILIILPWLVYKFPKPPGQCRVNNKSPAEITIVFVNRQNMWWSLTDGDPARELNGTHAGSRELSNVTYQFEQQNVTRGVLRPTCRTFPCPGIFLPKVGRCVGIRSRSPSHLQIVCYILYTSKGEGMAAINYHILLRLILEILLPLIQQITVRSHRRRVETLTR